MFKDLSQFVSDLSEMEMPPIDSVITSSITTIRGMVSQLQQLAANYGEKYNANRVYHYDSDMQYVDDTTDEMSAPATAVLENAVATIRGSLSFLSEVETGSKLHDIVPNSGHRPSVIFGGNILSRDIAGLHFNPSKVNFHNAELTRPLSDFAYDGVVSGVMLTRVGGVWVQPHGITLNLDSSGKVRASGWMYDRNQLYVNTTQLSTVNNHSLVDTLENVLDDFPSGVFTFPTSDFTATTNTIGLRGWLGEDNCVLDDQGGSLGKASNFMGPVIKNSIEGTLNWALYDQTASDIDAIQAILHLYPDFESLVEDIEALL